MATRVIINVPSSTQNCLVFPLNTSNQQFDTSFYNPGYTDGRAGIEEINQVVAEIQVARAPFVAKIKSAYCCYIAFIFIGLLAMVCLNGLLIASIGAPGAGIGFICYIIFIFIRVSTFRSTIAGISKDSKATCQKVIDKYSGSFTSRGLRWFLPVHFPLWIELHKDYMLQTAGQPIYMPPNMYQQPIPQQPQPQFQQPQPQYQQEPQPQFQNQYQDNYYQGQQPNGGVYNA